MTSHLTQWKEEAREIVKKYVRNDELDQPYLCGEPQNLKKDIESLVDHIHAHTLEEVREIVKQTPPNWNLMAFESGELIERDQMRSALELLEHPTD